MERVFDKYYCSPSPMSAKTWGAGSARIRESDVAQWLIERSPLLITDLVDLGSLAKKVQS